MIDYVFDDKEVIHFKDDATYKRFAEFFDTLKSVDDLNAYLDEHNYTDDNIRKTFIFLYTIHQDKDVWDQKVAITSKDTFIVENNNLNEIVRIINNNPDKKRYFINLDTFFIINDISLLKNLPNKENIIIGSKKLCKCFSLDDYIKRIEENSDLLNIYNKIRLSFPVMNNKKTFKDIIFLELLLKECKSEEELKRFCTTFYDESIIYILMDYYKMYYPKKYNKKKKWEKFTYEKAYDVVKINDPSSVDEILDKVNQAPNKRILVTLNKDIPGDFESLRGKNDLLVIGFDFITYSKIIMLDDFLYLYNKIKPLYEKISSYDLDNLSFEEITTIEEVIRKVREDDPEYSDVFLSLFYTDQVKKKKLCNVIIESFREMSWDSRKLLRSSDTFVIEGKEDIKEIVDLINANPNYKHYYIKLENKTYDNQELLEKLACKDNIFIEYSKDICCNVEEFLTMRGAIDYWKSVIKENNLSKLEIIMYAYDIIKGFMYNDDPKSELYPRRIHKILMSDKIVCVGYTILLEQLLHELGIDSEEIHVKEVREKDGVEEKHIRMCLKFSDPKYGITEEELFTFDPTWDSNKKYYVSQDEKGHSVYSRDEKSKEKEGTKEISSGDYLYKHFLVSLGRYKKQYKREDIVDVSKMYWGDSTMDKDQIQTTFKDSKSINSFTYKTMGALIYNVKRAEGYPKEMMADALREIFKINYNMNIDGEELIRVLLEEGLIEQTPLVRNGIAA